MKDSFKKPTFDTMSIIRIAPICNGKIYVVPRPSTDGTQHLDIPIEETIEQWSPKSEKAIRKIKDKYRLHIHTQNSPRYCVQYKLASHNEETVYLYVLPLNHEDEIQFQKGEFVTAEAITNEDHPCSPYLQKEIDLLGMAAELWNNYFPTNKKGME